MPRKRPIPEFEQNICRRVREWREGTNLPQVFVAKMIGVDSSYLASIEHWRTPLQYRYAYPLIIIGKLSPHWLATGSDRTDDFVGRIPAPDLLKNSKILFSEVYESNIRNPISGKISFLGGNIGREMARSWLEDEAARWAYEVEGKYLDDLVNGVIEFAETFLESRRSAPEAIASRQPRLDKLRSFHIARKAMLESPPLQNNVKALLSINPLKSHLRELIQRLIRATVQHGKKAELARFLSVPPQRVNDWLFRKKSPSGETTLRLLEWVTNEEAGQQKAPAGATNTRESKPTRKENHTNEILTDRPKRRPKSKSD